jgi:energy-coupling factor transporter transmembrane protein EcfT
VLLLLVLLSILLVVLLSILLVVLLSVLLLLLILLVVLLSALFVVLFGVLFGVLLPALLSVLLTTLLSILLVVLLVVLEDDNTLVDVGALDKPAIPSELGSSLVRCAAEEVGEADEVGSTKSSDITEVVMEVDKSDGRSGRSTVTAAVASAVVLPSALTFAVTATTTSAFEFVLIILGNIAVP